MEKQFSSPVYSLIKRDDEKYITERSYHNAKFSEDLVRDTLKSFANMNFSKKISVNVINYESIHKHNVSAGGEILCNIPSYIKN